MDERGIITGATGGSLRGVEAHELLQRRAPPRSPRVRRADKLEREPLRVEVGGALHEEEGADPHAVPQQADTDALEERLDTWQAYVVGPLSAESYRRAICVEPYE